MGPSLRYSPVEAYLELCLSQYEDDLARRGAPKGAATLALRTPDLELTFALDN